MPAIMAAIVGRLIRLTAPIDGLRSIRILYHYAIPGTSVETHSKGFAFLRFAVQYLVMQLQAIGKATDADAAAWRRKAEEYRVLAETCTQEAARQAFLALAASSELIAASKERQAGLGAPRDYPTAAAK
jgi:hypothetical protein